MNLINLFKKKEQTEMITEETLPDVQQIKVPDLKQYLLNGYKEIREVKNQNEQLQLKLEEESKYKLLYDGALVTLEEFKKREDENKKQINNLQHFHLHIKLMLNVLNVIKKYVWVQKLLVRRYYK